VRTARTTAAGAAVIGSGNGGGNCSAEGADGTAAVSTSDAARDQRGEGNMRY